MPEARSPATILVVDDNEANRYVVARILRSAGFAVCEAATGRDALRVAADGVDLAVLDVRLPDIHGFELCRQLRANPATRWIPILHISASFTGPEWKAQGLEGGADGYLTHPIEPLEVIATVRALLRARDAERQVRASAQEWSATFAALADGVCLTGPDGRIRRCNRVFAGFVGRAEGELVGEPLASLLPELAGSLDGELQGGQAPSGELAIGERWFQVAVQPVLDGSADAGAAWVLTEITRRKRVEVALRASEAHYRLLAEAIPGFVWRVNAEGRYEYVNRHWERSTGCTLRELNERGWESFVHPGELPLVRAQWEEARRAKRPFEMECRYRRHDGGYCWIFARIVPQKAEEGQAAGWVGIAVDIDTRKRTEEALRQTQRLESVGRLAGGIAHETNNQMNVVLGATHFILRNPLLPREVREDALQIQRAAERTAVITQQLLAFSRRQMLRPELLDLNAVVTGIEPILRRTLGESCALELRLSPAIGSVLADRGQLEQVLLNLVLNARDAMRSGGTLTVETAPVLVPSSQPAREGIVIRPGQYVLLTLRDTGHGMDQATLSRVFEPFFTTKGIGQGTGLGLSTAYGIVKQSSGYIWADSEPGAGTAFRIYLPMIEGPSPARGGAGGAGQPGSGCVVLVVEDQPDVLSLASRTLAGAGYTVLAAGSGEDALEILARHTGPLHALLVDMVMPGMDGLALAARVTERHPGTPVLYMSGYTDEEMLRRGVVDREQPFLQKPFAPEVLVVKLSQLIAATWGAAGQPTPR